MLSRPACLLLIVSTVRVCKHAATRDVMDKSEVILVVDDDESIRRALTKTFEKAGYQCAAASDGKAALACLAQGHVDLIITDMVMEGMDGTELLRRVARRKEPPVVVVITAYGCDMYERAAQRYGAFAYLPKPVPRKQLLEVAGKALASRRSVRGTQ